MTNQSLLAQPRYFGAGAQLFGMHHSAATDCAGHTAVLLCAPLGQDLIRSHRVYRQIADTLAADGIATLRFDYYGTGDSEGRSDEASLSQCIANTLAAADELRKFSGCDRISVVGARLGAAIALGAAASAGFAEAIVWDPIIDTASHVGRLDALQQQLRQDLTRFVSARSAEDAADQWLGFPVGAVLRRELLEFQLPMPSVPVQVFDSLHADAHRQWDVLTAAGATLTVVQPTTFWDDIDRLEHAILAPALVRVIRDHLRDRA